MARVEYRMPRHHSQLSARTKRPTRNSRSSRSNQMAVKTAKAACKEGQALAATSIVLRKDMEGCCDQSISNFGAAVGQIQKIPKPTTLSQSAAVPYNRHSRAV